MHEFPRRDGLSTEKFSRAFCATFFGGGRDLAAAIFCQHATVARRAMSDDGPGCGELTAIARRQADGAWFVERSTTRSNQIAWTVVDKREGSFPRPADTMSVGKIQSVSAGRRRLEARRWGVHPRSAGVFTMCRLAVTVEPRGSAERAAEPSSR
jgi:hypothetical protein